MEYFWLALIILIVVWYSTVTVYVAFMGAKDIKKMLARLKDQCDVPEEKCENK